ncbi:MAG: LysM peptidoglycan-binding domain-containing protein [Anaerolineales bacterium]|nr:LysM peptidoglycan-binding domain-containing protein [Anaerolineales bacterium]
MALEKATISGIDVDITVTCLFNPKEYTLSRTNNWDIKMIKGKNTPEVTFGGGQPATLTMQIFFDTYEDGTDVRKHTKGLWELMRINEDRKNSKTQKGEPPKVTFSWGQYWSFEAVIVSLTQKFTMFLQDGIPVRSTVDITFKQVRDEMSFAGTNPTSGGGEPHRVHVVQAGERLDWIAYQEYGDATKWRPIASANNLIRPARLKPGQKLIIPAQ